MLGEGFSGGARLAADWAEELRRRGLPLERALWLRLGRAARKGARRQQEKIRAVRGSGSDW